MRTSSSGGSGRAAASTSFLLRSRLGPRESGLRASGSVIAPTSVLLLAYPRLVTWLMPCAHWTLNSTLTAR